jgi:hypothetical protein
MEKSTSRAFISVIFSSSQNLFRENEFLRKKILDFLGKGWIDSSEKDWTHIRPHLDKHYCKVCGNYQFFSFARKDIKPHNHFFYKNNFTPILQQRLKIHRSLCLIELERYFSRVCYLPLEKYNFSASPSKRIPSLSLWTIDEWNLMFPEMFIRKDDNFHRMVHLPYFLQKNPLFIPNYVN